LKDKGYEEGKNLKLDVQNAQNQQGTANTIAANFVSNKVDMILAISTPSAQATYNKTNKIPILITAVTDPVGAGLAKSMDSSGNNVTGTSDNVPIDKQFDLLKQLIPDAKKVGVKYNTAEKNSQVQVDVATSGIDYYQLGYETGLKAVEIINGKEPKDLPITLLEEMELIINTDAVKKLNITVPSDILEKADTVTGGVK
jgi:ABC-type uncharacterized transport system substrate-binding protein